MQDRAVALLEQAPALVGQLRAATDAIEQGTPAATLGESPDNWSDAAQSVLDEAVAAGIEDHATVPAVPDHLRALSEERAQHESERRSNAVGSAVNVTLLTYVDTCALGAAGSVCQQRSLTAEETYAEPCD